MKKWLVGLLVCMLLLVTACANTETPAETVDTPVSSPASSAEIGDNNGSDEEAEWKEFLEEYEAFVDNYLEVWEKYQNNPTDMTILFEYTELAADATKWVERAEDISIDDVGEAAEFAKETARIAKKLADGMQ